MSNPNGPGQAAIAHSDEALPWERGLQSAEALPGRNLPNIDDDGCKRTFLRSKRRAPEFRPNTPRRLVDTFVIIPHDDPVKCIVTAGPTYEPLDQVRRLTNFSTGSLGVQLAAFLNQAKWPILESGDSPITLLLGEQATFRDKEVLIDNLIEFSTTRDLSDKLEALASSEVAAVFHAAAVSDFSIGNVWQEEDTGTRRKIEAGKISSRSANLLAELVPTPKIIAHLRDWFPNARLIGWKYETDGNRSDVLALSNQQIKDNATDYCVANGPAYGEGFGIVDGDGVCQHIATRDELFQKLQSFVAPVA